MANTSSGYSGTPLPKKLGIREGSRVKPEKITLSATTDTLAEAQRGLMLAFLAPQRRSLRSRLVAVRED